MKRRILWSLMFLLIGGFFLISGLTSVQAGIGSYKRAKDKVQKVHKQDQERRSKIFVGDAKDIDSDELVIDNEEDSDNDVGRFKNFKSRFK